MHHEGVQQGRHLFPSGSSMGPWTSHSTSLGCKTWGLNWTNPENLSSSNVLWILSQSKGLNPR